jgi:hypothetical protein
MVSKSTVDSDETPIYANASKYLRSCIPMGAAVAVLGNIELDRWYADIYGAMSLALRLSSLVRDRAAALKLAYNIRRLDLILSNMFTEIHKAIEKGMPKGRDVTPESIAEACESLHKLHGLLEKFLEACKRARLTNNSLMAGAIRNINNYNDEILELSDLLKLSLQPEVVKSIYNRAKAEKERGEIFDLSEV